MWGEVGSQGRGGGWGGVAHPQDSRSNRPVNTTDHLDGGGADMGEGLTEKPTISVLHGIRPHTLLPTHPHTFYPPVPKKHTRLAHTVSTHINHRLNSIVSTSSYLAPQDHICVGCLVPPYPSTSAGTLFPPHLASRDHECVGCRRADDRKVPLQSLHVRQAATSASASGIGLGVRGGRHSGHAHTHRPHLEGEGSQTSGS